MSNERPETPKKTSPHNELIELTSGVVAAYVSNNTISPTDLPQLIETVHKTLTQVGQPAAPQVDQKPAVSVKRSITKQAIICLECGKQQKTLKRHLGTAHGMTPAEYRAKWNLRPDYPLVAPEYAEKRRDLAKKIGLGRKPAAAKKAPPKRKTGGQKKG